MAGRRERAAAIVDALARAYPDSTCALRHDGPFQLLVATILSAQTPDAAVNAVTPRLFERYPDAHALAAARARDVAACIATLGLWRSKARHLVAMAQRLVNDHGGTVPRDLESLRALPGVGKKTATVVLGTAWGIAAGVAVDTHMLRINRLLGLSTAADPDRMSRDLERILPPESWPSYVHRIIDHGRVVCVARRPRCGVCPVAPLCPSAGSARAGYRPDNDGKLPASAANVSWKARAAASGVRARRPLRAPATSSRPRPRA